MCFQGITRRDIDAAVARIAVAQENIFSRAQVLAAGGDDALIRRRLRAGVWIQHAPGVYGLAGPASFQRRLWIAHLGSGPESLVSFQAAGAMWEYLGCPPNKAIVTGKHSNWQRLEGVVVHQINDVLPHHRTTISGLPITTRARTFVDLAAVWGRARLATVLDDQVTHRNVSYVEVGEVLKDVSRRGKPGVQMLASILDDRGPGHVPPASEAERMLLDALRAAGEPEPVRQYPFPGRQFTNGCTDTAYPPERLIVEVDSRRWHARIADLKRDHERDAEAGAEGWYTHRVMAENVKSDPEGEVRRIRTIRLQRRRQLGLNSTQ